VILIYPSTAPAEAGPEQGFSSPASPPIETWPLARPSLFERTLGFLLRYLGRPE
jgi:hypothetical protein